MPEKEHAPVFAAISIAAALAVGGGIFLFEKSQTIEICDSLTKTKCEVLTKGEYTALKTGLAEKVRTDDPLSWEEYQILISVMDHELKGGKNVGRVDSERSMKQALNSILYAN